MKAYFICIASLFFIQTLFAQNDTILVNGVKFFTTQQTVITEYGKKDTILKLYSLKNGKPEYLLSHYLFKFGVDAENEFTDIGTIQIQNDSIVLGTHYLQKKKRFNPCVAKANL